LPLGTEDAQAKVNGQVILQNNTLHLVDWNMVLSAVNGQLHFTEDELLADKIDAELFAEPVTLSIKSINKKPQDHITEIDLAGKANLGTIQQNLQLDFLSYLQGMANYQAVIQLHSDTAAANVFNISSDLNGVSVNLPEPFAKESNSILNCSASYAFGGKGLTQAKIVYGNRASAALSFKKLAKDKKQLFGGEIVLGQGEANFRNTPGIYVFGKLNKLEWSVWHDLLFPKNKSSQLSSNIAKVHLDLNELDAFGQKLQKVILQVEPSDGNWLLELTNANIQGQILIPGDLLHGEIRGELSKLYLQKQGGKSAELSPSDFPALNFLVDDFRYGDMPLGQVELRTKPAKNGLQIALLKVLAQRFSLSAKGSWNLVAGNNKTELSGKLSSNNFGALLQDFSVTNSLIGGNATANFNLHWPSAFFNPNFKAIEGAFNIAIKNGRIINLGSKTETELGFGRVLNLLSLQTLPRRLTLDFSDLLKQGFSFDTLSGDIEVENGSLYTDNLRLDGPAAQVSIDGRVGFRDKDYDMLLTTVAHLTSSIPVIAAIAVNPIVGVATYVADKIIAPAVTNRVSTTLYRIRGTWDNPKIDKI